LRALRASDLVELWNSDQSGLDSLGTMAKYSAPTIANGRVYVATRDNALAMYGLIPSGTTRGRAIIRGQAAVR
jgi:hypothetical protein